MRQNDRSSEIQSFAQLSRVSGYDLLALLPDKLERAVQNNDILAARQLDRAAGLVRDLAAADGLNAGETNSLLAKLSAAQDQLASGNSTPAAKQLANMLNELDALMTSGRVSQTDAADLRSMIAGLMNSIS